VDDNVRAYISLKAADRWLSVRLELLGAGVVGIGAVLSVHGTAMGHLGMLLPSLPAFAFFFLPLPPFFFFLVLLRCFLLTSNLFLVYIGYLFTNV
jgi:hypothetical protein